MLYIFSYLLLTYNMTFNIIRQSISIFIILYSYKFIETKNYLKYIIGVIVATMFHTSALICALFPMIKIISNRKHTLYLILLEITLSLLDITLSILMYMMEQICLNYILV